MGDTEHRDASTEWLDHVRPVGLVVSPAVLRELGLTPERQGPNDTAAAAALIEAERDVRANALADPWSFAREILGWPAAKVAGVDDGPALPDDLCARLPEHDTNLRPTWAVLNAGTAPGYQLLVQIEDRGIDPDKRGAIGGWEATAQQRFERLLRETGVYAGVLISDDELRLVFAPSGETSGWLAFPLRSLTTVAGRSMLGGLKLVLGAFRLFNDGPGRRLPDLLKRSREAQASVSAALASQVLGALHDLLRGFNAANPELTEELSRKQPEHAYEGLLTVLMRLVFILFAEDRDLIPSRNDAAACSLYDRGYSLRQLFVKLRDDATTFPDTMDERYGAWGRLLALFRLIHAGDGTGWIRGRGGKLFDPQAFPFLEGRVSDGDKPSVLKVSDGAILRILNGLMTLDGERLSYRTLDVEQIGSVYETVMGFTVEVATGPSLAIKAGKNNRTPVFVDLDKLVALGGDARLKFLKEDAERSSLSDRQKAAIKAARDISALVEALSGIIDQRGSPQQAPAPPGAPILQPTDERRRSGSHYTPRSLTEPIVRHALEPAFERLSANARPEDVLDLKVCDPAMGSGAFLVEACRQLGQRLVQAWTRWPETKPKIPADEDDELHAKRLVAQRCLYGVDKNPMATDLARLSLWLATLARDHEFTFLDHALKSGDSLVGLTRAQIGSSHWDPSSPPTLFHALLNERVDTLLRVRDEIRSAPDDVARRVQEVRHTRAEEYTSDARIVGDALVEAFMASNSPKNREANRVAIQDALAADGEATWAYIREKRKLLRQGSHPVQPFHWEIEFPEVFRQESSGFDCVVGNPPFLGGSYITRTHGSSYFSYLTTNYPGCAHHCDLVGYFIRRMYSLIRPGGTVGVIATKTIAQGDTREGALTYLLRNGAWLSRVRRAMRWPGEANVYVVLLHLTAVAFRQDAVLDNKRVPRISAFLMPGEQDSSPRRLSQNPYISQGSQIYGKGFLFDDTDAGANPTALMRSFVIAKPEIGARILPFIGGDEVNSTPQQASHRFAIFLSDIPDEEGLSRWEPLSSLVRERVRPARMLLRDTSSGRQLKKKWWAYQAHRPKLYSLAKPLDRVLLISLVSSHLAFAFVGSRAIFSHKLGVIPDESPALFACVQSRVHEVWTRFLSAPVGDGFSYSPADCFGTFPFPSGFRDDPRIGSIGEDYHSQRAQLMLASGQGLTEVYNLFHNSANASDDVCCLRNSHEEMDRAVLNAYGWDDLALKATPIFLDDGSEDDTKYQGRLFWRADLRDEVLARLLSLNALRAEEERRAGVAALPLDDDSDDAEDD